VLELGCASGDNLAGMAYGLPGASFAGLDLSPRQVEAGRRRVQALGLANVSLRAGDLRDATAGLGEFDFVVAHGVLSWVPEAVRVRLFEVCRERLAPGGVAFVSWNALPGWRFRGLVREVLLAGASGADEPRERARRARERLELVAASAFDPASPWSRYLAERLGELRDESDADLLHDYLEADNEAFSLRDVVDRALSAGLEYLCDAQEPFVPEEPVSPDLKRTLDSLPDDVEREALLDVLRERTLRQGLFVRAGETRRRPAAADVVAPLHAGAPPATDAAGSGALHGTATDGDVGALRSAALRTLRAAWPATVPAASIVAPEGAADGAALAEGLLRLQREGLVELRTTPLSCGAPPSPRPRATALARLQAREGPRVTSLRHRNVALDPLATGVLVLLDGTRTTAEVAEACGLPPPLVAAVVDRLRSDSLLEA